MVAAYEAIPIPFPQPNTRFSPSRAVTTTVPMFSHPLWADGFPPQQVPSDTTDAPTSTIVPVPTENFPAYDRQGVAFTPGDYEYSFNPAALDDNGRYGGAQLYINPFSGVK